MKRCLQRRGQALLEFIVVFPFLIFFLIFSFYAFLTFCDYLTLQQMTREALRQASIETGLSQEITQAKLDSSGLLMAYQRGAVAIVSRVNDSAVSESDKNTPDAAKKKFYENSYSVAVTINKKPEIPNVLGFMNFMTEEKEQGMEFPPRELSYRLDMRPEQ